MRNKFLKKVALTFLSISMLTPITTANAEKDGFYFNLLINVNEGRVYSDRILKTDSENYGAVTTNYNDLIWSDKVYYKIHRNNWYGGRIEATGYYRVTGNGTLNLWYYNGQSVYNSNYQLEGDTDVHNAVVSGIWEP
ncbi:hypothetical protein [Fundicoccus culcitae]|uniref:Uncharacterized protein n=1 Tax=Fundicoccus culcitae TaxID=2969821 RepID=A0ABY5P6I3_9LACT|nr:hypothetical protein [Fundicoccus culcitae]UUX34341.1 hypothetical protein NRE15_01445 [Fundicoccus culcitae]